MLQIAAKCCMSYVDSHDTIPSQPHSHTNQGQQRHSRRPGMYSIHMNNKQSGNVTLRQGGNKNID